MSPHTAPSKNFPNSHIINTRTHAHARAHSLLGEVMARSGDLNAAFGVLLDRKGDKPLQHDMLVSFANSFAEVGDVDKTLGLLTRAFKELNLKANVDIISILVKLFVRAGEPDKGFQVLRRMQHDGVAVDVVPYHTLIRGYVEQGSLDRVKELLEELLVLQQKQIDALRADQEKLAAIASGEGAAAAGGSASTLLVRANNAARQAAFRAARLVDRRLLVLVLRACLEHRDAEGALQTLERMRAMGMDPDVWCYNKVLALLASMKEPTSLETYLAVLNHFFESPHAPNLGTVMHTTKAFASAGPAEVGADAEAQRTELMDAIVKIVGLQELQLSTGDSAVEGAASVVASSAIDERALDYFVCTYLDHAPVTEQAAERLLSYLARLQAAKVPHVSDRVLLSATSRMAALTGSRVEKLLNGLLETASAQQGPQ